MAPATPLEESRASTRAPRSLARALGTHLDALAGWLLVLLALVLPVEWPLFRVGPLQITSVELALYSALAAWGLSLAWSLVEGRWTPASAWGEARRDALVQSVIVWLAVLFVSAAAAPADRSSALKFALRSLSGGLVFFAARTLTTRRPEVARRVLWALVAGAVVSAATALVDDLFPGSGAFWALFRGGREAAFGALGLPRASGVFGYPTMGAMYWEAAVPLVLVVPLGRAPLTAARGPSTRGLVAALVAAGVLMEAILASATRTALVGAAVGALALLVLAGGPRAWLGRTSLQALVVLAAALGLALLAPGSGSLLAQRLRWWKDPQQWLRVEYRVDEAPRAVAVAQPFELKLALHNGGTVTWTHDGPRPVHLAYHWEPIGRPATVADYEGHRTVLPADVPAGETIEVVGLLYGPREEGPYRLRVDMVQEGVAWFSDQGNPTPQLEYDVARSEGAGGLGRLGARRRSSEEGAASRLALWRAAVALWRTRPVLGIGPDDFRRRYQGVIAVPPGGVPYTDTRIHANSWYFETLADLGLAGLAALAFLGWSAWGRVRDARRLGDPARAAFAVAAALFFVHGALDYFFEFTPLFGLFWLLLGLSPARASPPPGGVEQAPAARRPTAGTRSSQR